MGVKYLWTILTPFCDRKPLYELQGKTVAVDLSCWICEAQNIAEYQVQPRMYLRNLYFRTCYLLLMDVNPVFVLEGKAPELKYDTISARNAIQFKGAKPKTDGIKTGKDRTRFHFVLRQCEEMLGYMGIACIKGKGEAESLCAYLNEDGLVDGCISQDSDCFAYGAQVVYRNFSISTQGTQAASGGAVDVYDIKKANQSLSFGRNKIVAMALLIGCDYSDGVHGIGKDSVLKFFETVSDDKVLDKLRSWRSNKDMYENYEKQLADKNICSSCGHDGKIQGHTKHGCASCKTTTGCDPFKYKNERLKMRNELNMRNKAIKDPKFPDEILIKEFLDRKDDVKELDLKWKQPDIVKFLKFTTKFLQWDELYSFEKILPILARWQCRNPELLKNEDKLKGVLIPHRIKKVRNPKGVSSYEIIWSDPSGYFKGLIPEGQILENNVDLDKLWSTIEPQNLVEYAYPQLVENFKQSKIKPKKIGKRKKNKPGNIDEITDKLDNVSITEPKSKKPRKPKTKTIKTTDSNLTNLDFGLKQLTIENPEIAPLKLVEDNVCDGNSKETIDKQKKTSKSKAKTLDGFVKKAMAGSYKQGSTDTRQHNAKEYPKMTVDGSLYTMSSTPAKAVKTDLWFDLDVSSFGDESELELSDIIDDIIFKKYFKDDLQSIADKYVQGHYGDESVKVVCVDDCSESQQFDVDQRSQSDNAEESLPKMDKCDTRYDDNYQGNLEGDQSHFASFFMSNPAEENDLFEKTFNGTFKNFKDSSGSDTEDYEYKACDNIAIDKENKDLRDCDGQCQKSVAEEDDVNVICLSSDDDSSFNGKYVPLYERLKRTYILDDKIEFYNEVMKWPVTDSEERPEEDF